MKSLIPKVLLAAPTSDRHKHLLDDWIKSLDNLTYENFKVLLVDTTSDSDEYSKILKKKLVHKNPIKVISSPWEPEKLHILRHLAHVRDLIRKEMLKGDYTHLFFLDSDIFVPENAIQMLLWADKDNCGFPVTIYDKMSEKPCVFKSGNISFSNGLDLYEFDEIDAFSKFSSKFSENKLNDSEKKLVPFIIKDKSRPHLFPVYAVNIGCLMIKREVLKEVPFRTHDSILFGEDIWFFSEANDKGFEFWCDPNVKPLHKNVQWSTLKDSSEGLQRMHLIQGPEDAKEVEFVKEVNEETETKIFVMDG